MDFFAANAAAQGTPVAVRYPMDTLFSPAHVAVLATTRRVQAARLFADFVLSPEGQRLLLDPAIGRLPMRPAAYRAAPARVINPFSVAELAEAHDTMRGLQRQPIVSALFDAAFTNRHEQLVFLWKKIRAAERAGRDGSDRAAIQQARALATMLPITEHEADDPALSRLLGGVLPATGDDATLPTKAQLLERWNGFFAENYARALTLLEDVRLS
jgi:hypothetical protein